MLIGVEHSHVRGHCMSCSIPFSQQPVETGAVVIPVFQERRLRHREGKRHAQVTQLTGSRARI